MIVYDKLWQTMKEKGISQYALIKKHNGIFSGGCHPTRFPFFLLYEAFASVFVSFSCFGFNHSSSEKLQSLVSLAQRPGCFFFASS